MNEKLKKLLIARGLKADATDAEATAYMKAENIEVINASGETPEIKTITAASAPVVSPEVAALRAESVRIAGINALNGDLTIKAAAITNGDSVDKTELALLRASRPSAPGVMIAKPQDLDSAILVCAALMKKGYPMAKLEKQFDQKTLNAADRRRSVSFKGMIAACCALDGRMAPEINASPDEWIRAGFSGGSLSGILSNLANKVLELPFESNADAAAVFQVCKEIPLNDLKQHSMYRLLTGSKLPEVPGGGPLEYDYLQESSRTIQAKTHGKLIGITRDMIINDDLLAFMSLPEKISRDGFEQFADDFVNMLEVLAVAGGAAAFFGSTNKNVDTSSKIPNGTGYAVMKKLFAAMLDDAGKRIGVRPAMVITPTALTAEAESAYASLNLLATAFNKDATASQVTGDANINRGKYKPIEISRLSSDSVWYPIADPNIVPAFAVGFLNGRRTPTVEEVAVAPEYLGRAFRVIWDYAFALDNYQGALRMS
jgi:hypothetical protein